MKTDATWVEVDLDTLTTDQRDAYEMYKVAQRQAAQLRQAFETAVAQDVPMGSRMVFGYRFGKLSVALVPDDSKPKAAKVAPKSLAAYLAEQAAR